MGCVGTKLWSAQSKKEGKTLKWASEQPLSIQELQSMRDQFWDTEPYYGGNKVIWDALKAAFTGDASMREVIIRSAGIIRGSDDLSVLYDETGVKYEIPKYVICNPTNLIKDQPRDTPQDDAAVQA